MRDSLTTGKLLSNYSADFWEVYKNNNTHYDNMFARLFKSFVYYDQEDDEDVETVTNNFIKCVYDYLLLNDKRLSELWRVNVVPDDENYNILENYFREDIYTANNQTQGASTSGQRTDINNINVGAQTSENVDKVVAHNTSAENTANSSKSATSSRNDINQFTQGQQNNTSRTTENNSYTLKSHGAIGTMTADQVIFDHWKKWSEVDAFYEFVFNEICTKFLLLGV